MKHALALLFSLVIVTGALAAPAPQDATTTTQTTKKTTHKAASTTVSKQIDDMKTEMKQAIESQQQQIQELRQQLATRDQAIQQLQQRIDQNQAAAVDAQAKASAAASQVGEQQQKVTQLDTDVSDIKLNNTSVALSLQETQKNFNDAIASPSTLHFKGITLTPGGFLAAETVWRQHALASDVNTPFNSVPYPGASQNQLSEFYGTGRQSRISLLAEGKLSSAKIGGYYEADFLSSAITSNNNQSGSYSLRQRQVWAQAALNSGWTFTGGQMWSLVTETKKGLDNRTEAPPMVIDPAYNVGFSWARQYGFRVSKSIGKKMWVGGSVEDSQATVGGHGPTCTVASGTSTISYPCNNYLLGAQGTSGGLYNPTSNYSYNGTPDFVFKIAAEPGWGHFEVFGVISDFRDRLFPGAIPAIPTSKISAAGAYNNWTIGGGIGANARGSVLNKKVDIGLHYLGGNGVGRYGASALPDIVIRPDGVTAPIRSYQGLATVEYHGKKLDLYANEGGEYAARTIFNGGTFGYGSPLFVDSGCSTETLPTVTVVNVSTPGGGTTTVPVVGAAGTPLTPGFNPGGLSKCSGDTKSVWETSVGFWYRFYKGDRGTMQFGSQYARVIRNAWSGGGFNPQGNDNMLFTSFRYYIP
jgi:hypothetical protein